MSCDFCILGVPLRKHLWLHQVTTVLYHTIVYDLSDLLWQILAYDFSLNLILVSIWSSNLTLVEAIARPSACRLLYEPVCIVQVVLMSLQFEPAEACLHTRCRSAPLHCFVDLDLLQDTLLGLLRVQSTHPIDASIARIQSPLFVYLAVLEVLFLLALSKNATAYLEYGSIITIKIEEVVSPVHLRLDPSELSGLGQHETVLPEHTRVPLSVTLWILQLLSGSFMDDGWLFLSSNFVIVLYHSHRVINQVAQFLFWNLLCSSCFFSV